MKLTTLFEKGTFVITGEIGPTKGCTHPRGDAAPACANEAETLRGWVHAVNVTDNQSAVMRLGSLASSVHLKGLGFEPVFQLTCRDRNRIALQSDLLNACSLGIENALLLTGDHISLGDHVQAKPVFDIDSVQLLRIARGLNEGRDMNGNALSQPTDLALGAVVNPSFEPLALQLMKMEKKVEAGAQFFQTQAVYDPRNLEALVQHTEGWGVPIQAGVVVLKSPQMGRFMNQHVSGITVPDAWIEEIGSVDKAQRRDKAAAMTLRLVREIQSMVQGLHFMPLGWSDLVPRVVSALGLTDLPRDEAEADAGAGAAA